VNAGVLRPGGWLVIELGFGTRDYVAGSGRTGNDVRIELDLAGIPRVLAAPYVDSSPKPQNNPQDLAGHGPLWLLY
jgi:hypothetical protein